MILTSSEILYYIGKTGANFVGNEYICEGCSFINDMKVCRFEYINEKCDRKNEIKDERSINKVIEYRLMGD